MEQSKKGDIINKIKQLYKEEGESEEWKNEQPIMEKLVDTIRDDIEKRGYTINEPFAMGSTGILCKVKDESLSDERLNVTITRALKIPRPILKKKEVIMRALAGEAEILLMLNHENIVKVYYRGEVEVDREWYPFFIMEYVEGETLDNFFSTEESMSCKEILAIFKGIVYGLIYLHRQEVVHCDIKPKNILVANDLTAKITDLGYSHKLTSEGTLTSVRTTFHYAHPDLKEAFKKEVSEGRKKGITDFDAVPIDFPANKIEFRFDLYALGMSLIELIELLQKQKVTAFTDYEKNFLYLIIMRLLDGYFPKELRGLVDELPEWVRKEIKYGGTSEVKDDFDKLTYNYPIEERVPELNPYLGSIVQIPGSMGVPFTKRVKETVEHPCFARLNHLPSHYLFNRFSAIFLIISP